jgi:2-(1,2-epoxy-1,2-dihydrophenyl)acetyl-CoA isomerase
MRRAVGEQTAKAMILFGEVLDGPEAQRLGLVWKCVDDERLDAEVDALAVRLAGMPTRALAAIKQSIRHAATATLDAQLDLERDLQTRLGASHDYAEGVNAFLQKRPARFEGR